MKNIVIMDYGAGNVKSVSFAFERLGYSPVLSADSEVIKSADYVVFPGVGHAKTAMNALRENKLVELIPNLKQPVLGVCLGMQLMCNFSEEGDTRCLGIFDAEVKRFNPKLKVPHMGWNDLKDGKEIISEIEEQVYFVHSYYVPVNANTIAKCDYHGDFSAAMSKGNFYGCQFHPEKSGNAGELILQRFLDL